MTPAELALMRMQEELRAVAKRWLNEQDVWQTCLHCCHFNEKTEGCALAQGARPPARVIVFGCPQFLDGEGDGPVEAPKPAPVVSKPKTGFDDLDDDIPF